MFESSILVTFKYLLITSMTITLVYILLTYRKNKFLKLDQSIKMKHLEYIESQTKRVEKAKMV